MRVLTGVNLFDVDCQAVCITTNGFVKMDGLAVMGRGCAMQLANLFPHAPRLLGAAIKRNGNITQPLFMANDTVVLAFPVKPDYVINSGSNLVSHAQHMYKIGQKVPGFHAKSDIELIKQSAIQLKAWADETNHTDIVLPRTGCGAGELSWVHDVYPVLNEILDDRFTAVSY